MRKTLGGSLYLTVLERTVKGSLTVFRKDSWRNTVFKCISKGQRNSVLTVSENITEETL